MQEKQPGLPGAGLSLPQAIGLPLLGAQQLADLGCQLSIEELDQALAQAWIDIRSGQSTGGKSVLSLPADEFWRHSGLSAEAEGFIGERLGWKLSCLYSVNPAYAGVKIIGANAFNRRRRLPRSTSTFILLEKMTMRPLAILDATELSASRTGLYAAELMRIALAERHRLTVFLFGAGPVAHAILQTLASLEASRIERVIIRARTLSSARALKSSLGTLLPFELLVVEDNRLLSQAQFVVTATNSDHPVFADQELARDAVMLHLGGDEVPPGTLQRILRTGFVGCDDLATVSRRNSQSLALQFSRAGGSLEVLGPFLGILELSKAADWQIEAGKPVSVTCVGLPMLDLYAVAALYEKYLCLSRAAI